MLRPRIIPCLLINNNDLVNTNKFSLDKSILLKDLQHYLT